MIPHFTIVTPCLNYARHLDQTILSVVSQEGDFSLHYHVQDGGSSDGTLERLAWWETAISRGHIPAACRDMRFTYDSRRDGGIYDAVNRGFGRTGGGAGNTWMTWVNASDRLQPGALQTVVRFSAAVPDAAWVSGRRAHVDESGFAFFLDDTPYGYPRRTLALGLHVGRVFEWVQPEGSFWLRSLWERVGGGIDTRWRLAGDTDLWRRFAAHAPLVVVDRPLGAFRFHAGRLSADIGVYLDEVDRMLVREGLTGAAAAAAADFARLVAAEDIDGLFAHGFTGPVARWSNGRSDGAWRVEATLPYPMPGWAGLAQGMGLTVS